VAASDPRIPEQLKALGAPLTFSGTGDWQGECVDCPRWFQNLTDRSLQFDSQGWLHIAYGGDHLYHAWHDGITWQIKTVDPASGVGGYASLVQDVAGRPHISYFDRTNATLKLALDQFDRPHIGFYDESVGDLWYAWYDGADWQVQTVPAGSEGDVGRYTALALDGGGQLHIGCYDASNRDLRYVRLMPSLTSTQDWQVYLPLVQRGE
jgi:hypothetical protein